MEITEKIKSLIEEHATDCLNLLEVASRMDKRTDDINNTIKEESKDLTPEEVRKTYEKVQELLVEKVGIENIKKLDQLLG